MKCDALLCVATDHNRVTTTAAPQAPHRYQLPPYYDHIPNHNYRYTTYFEATLTTQRSITSIYPPSSLPYISNTLHRSHIIHHHKPQITPSNLSITNPANSSSPNPLCQQSTIFISPPFSVAILKTSGAPVTFAL